MQPDELFPPLPDRPGDGSDRTILWAAMLGGRDALTGCWTTEALQLHAASLAEPCTLVHIDLPGFIHVNTAVGHTGGDALLVDFVHRLARQLPPEPAAFLARTGGDEFAVLVADPDTAAEIVAHVDATLAEPRLVQPQFRGRDERRVFEVWFPPGRVATRQVMPDEAAITAALDELRADDEPRIRPVIVDRT